MDAVEVPQGQDRMFPARRADVYREVNYVHDRTPVTARLRLRPNIPTGSGRLRPAPGRSEDRPLRQTLYGTPLRACRAAPCSSIPTSGIADLQNEAIISQFHARRQQRTRLGVRQVVADVSEVRALAADARGDGHGLRDAEMRGVRAVAERVDNERPDALQ